MSTDSTFADSTKSRWKIYIYFNSRKFQKAKVIVQEVQKQLFWLPPQNVFFFFFPSSLTSHILGITDNCFHLGACLISDLLIMSRTKKIGWQTIYLCFAL